MFFLLLLPFYTGKKTMLTVNKYKEVLLEEFYLDSDDLTIRRKKDGWRGKYVEHDAVKPYKLCSHGYRGVHIPRTRTTVSYTHLITLLRGTVIPEGAVVDHIDGDNTNDTRSNLRVTTQSMNCRNSKMKKNNTSGYTGISWNSRANCYIVRKQINGERKYFGSSETLEGAQAILKNAEAEYSEQGYTARHGI